MIDKIISYTIIVFFIIFPFFYLPITAESYEYNKMALLVLTDLVLIALTAVKIYQKRALEINKNPFTLPLFFLSVIFIISTLFQSPNIVVTLTTPLSTATIAAGFIFFLLLVLNLEGESIQNFVSFLIVDACLISVFILSQKLGIFPDNSYTPAGTLLSTAAFLSVITVYLLVKIINTLILKTDRDPQIIILHLLALLLTGGTAVFLTVQLATVQKPTILPFAFGWIIFLEVIKNLRTFALGVGPANFVTAFSLVKPVAFNNTPYWNLVFNSSSSFFLNLVTETGVFAGLFYLAILLKSLRLFKSPSGITLLFTLLLLIFLPANMTVFITAVILLAASSHHKPPAEISLKRFGILSSLIFLPVILLLAVSLYFGTKFYWAEVSFKESLDATLNGRGDLAYKLQNEAIVLNSSMDRYRVAFSRTSLALANAIASKSKLSDTDKQNIPNLVKQSIDQARTAVVLNRTNEINWDNLGRVYSALIGYAQGAENWAAYSFQQKLILDPTNPNTYLALVGLNLELNKFAEAEFLAGRAAALKPDLANAYYFLNLALQGQKKYKEAYNALQKAYSLLQPDSADSKKVAGELEELKKLVPKEATGAAQTETPARQTQNLKETPASTSAIQNLPEGLPTISLQQPPN